MSAPAASQPDVQSSAAVPAETLPSTQTADVQKDEAADPAEASAQDNEAALAAKRYRDMQRAKARDEKPALLNQSAPMNQSAPGSTVPAPASVVSDASKSGPRKVTVTVSYDESGRVTQASGGDASAVRIARQKRFPAGKAGSATITIPIN